MGYQVTILLGEKKLEPVQYRLVTEQHGPWWWRQPAYYIETDLLRLGPFYEKREALEILAIARRA